MVRQAEVRIHHPVEVEDAVNAQLSTALIDDVGDDGAIRHYQAMLVWQVDGVVEPRPVLGKGVGLQDGGLGVDLLLVGQLALCRDNGVRVKSLDEADQSRLADTFTTFDSDAHVCPPSTRPLGLYLVQLKYRSEAP